MRKGKSHLLFKNEIGVKFERMRIKSAIKKSARKQAAKGVAKINVKNQEVIIYPCL